MFQYEPFTMLNETGDGAIELTGFYADIFNTLQQKLNFTWVINSSVFDTNVALKQFARED